MRLINDDVVLDDVRAMISDCRDRAGKLQKNSIAFLDMLDAKLATDGGLLPAQLKRINSLWDRVTRNG
jgi:hypothetical protein